MSDDKTVYVASDDSQGSIWGQTMGLRLVNRFGRIYPVLQQLWVEHSTGKEDWRDVPFAVGYPTPEPQTP